MPNLKAPYACRACQEVVVQAPAPARLIEGGLPTEALVAHVAYLACVISRIVEGHPQSDIDALLPWNCRRESATLAA